MKGPGEMPGDPVLGNTLSKAVMGRRARRLYLQRHRLPQPSVAPSTGREEADGVLALPTEVFRFSLADVAPEFLALIFFVDSRLLNCNVVRSSLGVQIRHAPSVK